MAITIFSPSQPDVPIRPPQPFGPAPVEGPTTRVQIPTSEVQTVERSAGFVASDDNGGSVSRPSTPVSIPETAPMPRVYYDQSSGYNRPVLRTGESPEGALAALGIIGLARAGLTGLRAIQGRRTASQANDYLMGRPTSSPVRGGSGGSAGTRTTTTTVRQPRGVEVAKGLGKAGALTAVNTAAVGAGAYLISLLWNRNPYTITVVDRTTREPISYEQVVERVTPEVVTATEQVVERVVEPSGGSPAAPSGYEPIRIIDPYVPGGGSPVNVERYQPRQPAAGAEIPVDVPQTPGGIGGGEETSQQFEPTIGGGFGGGSNPSAGCEEYVNSVLSQTRGNVSEAREIIAETRSECLDVLRSMVSP